MYRNFHQQAQSGQETLHQSQPAQPNHQNHVVAGHNGQQTESNYHHGNNGYESHGNRAVNGYDHEHATQAVNGAYHQGMNGASHPQQNGAHNAGNATIQPTAGHASDGKGGYTTSFYINGKQPSSDTTHAHAQMAQQAAYQHHQHAQQQQQHQQLQHQLQQKLQHHPHHQQQKQQQQQQHQQLQQQHLQQQLQQQHLLQQQQQQHEKLQQQQQHAHQLQQHLQYQKSQQNQQQQQHYQQQQQHYDTNEPIYQQPYAHPIPPPPSYPAPHPGQSPHPPQHAEYSTVYSTPNSTTHPTPHQLQQETQRLANISISQQNHSTHQTNQPTTYNGTSHSQPPFNTDTHRDNQQHQHHPHQMNRISSDPRLYSIQDEDALTPNETETASNKSPSSPNTKSFVDPSRVVPIMYEQKTFHVIPPPPPLMENVFAGRRDVRDPKSVPEKEIVSNKGTVRGFTNRVRAGIATFWAQPEDERNYRQQEKGKIIVYATSMSVVRETSERCKSVRNILQNHMVRYEERDLYMSREIQSELKHRLSQEGMTTEEIKLPHIFADGIRIGGAGELERLNEAGELRALLEGYQKINVRFACQRCGGYRYVPCDVCHGSKRSLLRNHFTEDFFALRCMHCDDSGLRRCDLCKEQQE